MEARSMPRATQQRPSPQRTSPNGSKRISNARTPNARTRRSGDKQKFPVVAGSAAAAGLAAGAAGTLLGSKLRSRRRRRVLGVRMPRGAEIKSGAEWLGRMQSDLRAVHAQAAESRKQSPIEVVLAALTSRRLPRHDT
jgi:hypothetical protein